MNICIISAHSFGKPGGVRTHIINLSKQLEDKGHTVTILAPKSRKKTKFNTNIDNLIEVGHAVTIPVTGTYSNITFMKIDEIKKIFEKNKFDILHFHNFLPFISTDISYYAENLPKVFTLHALPEGFVKLLTPNFVRNVTTLFKHIIFVSESQKEYFKEAPVNYSIIPNGINIKTNQKPRDIKGKDEINLLYVGRVEPRKGIDYLLKAYQNLVQELDSKNINFHVVGKGPLDFLNKITSNTSDRENVIFHGSVSDKKLKEIRENSDIYISPAIKGESFGIVLLESMSAGIPTIAFDNEGYRTVMINKLSECLAINKDVEDLTKKIKKLINSPSYYKEISRIGLDHCKNYDWDKVSDKILKVYEKAV